MRGWTRLIAWAEEERVAAEFYARLARAAAWHEQGTAGLWRDPELTLGLRWRDENRPNKRVGGSLRRGVRPRRRVSRAQRGERDRAVALVDARAAPEAASRVAGRRGPRRAPRAVDRAGAVRASAATPRRRAVRPGRPQPDSRDDGRGRDADVRRPPVGPRGGRGPGVRGVQAGAAREGRRASTRSSARRSRTARRCSGRSPARTSGSATSTACCTAPTRPASTTTRRPGGSRRWHGSIRGIPSTDSRSPTSRTGWASCFGPLEGGASTAEAAYAAGAVTPGGARTRSSRPTSTIRQELARTHYNLGILRWERGGGAAEDYGRRSTS